MQIEKSTEILGKDENGTLVWRMGPEMPYSLTGHCVVQLSKNKFFLIGGLFKEIVKFLKITLRGAVVNFHSGQQWEQEHPSLQSRHLFLYDSKNETNPWTERSPMTERRFGHSCGLITVDGDKKIVVAGGQTGDVMTKSNIRQIEIYDIKVHNDILINHAKKTIVFCRLIHGPLQIKQWVGITPMGCMDLPWSTWMERILPGCFSLGALTSTEESTATSMSTTLILASLR